MLTLYQHKTHETFPVFSALCWTLKCLQKECMIMEKSLWKKEVLNVSVLMQQKCQNRSLISLTSPVCVPSGKVGMSSG